MNSHFDIVIAGGGMVGNTLACALGESGLRVGVIEPQVPEAARAPGGFDLRVSALTIASQTVLEKLGAWPAVRERAAPVEAMRVWEGESALHYDSAEIGEPCLVWIVENRALVAALAARLKSFTNVTLLCPEQLAEVEFADERAMVTLASGRRLSARLLVGADGAQSKVRAAAGIGWQQHDLGQSAIVAVVRTEQPHANTACQHFLPTGPLAFLPLPDPNLVSIVWSADSARAAELMQLDDVVFNTELQAAFGDLLGRVALASARAAIPLALGFAEHYVQHRVALIGDAAHTVHPLAGQGVNLGILDAVTLAEVLLEAAQGQRDVGAHARLRRYERARKGADVGMQLVTGGFRYLFGSPLAPVRALRGAGLALTEHLPPLKHFFMRRASGLSGELPKLAQRVLR
jgi:2-octaprenylphenol hydroxylase